VPLTLSALSLDLDQLLSWHKANEQELQGANEKRMEWPASVRQQDNSACLQAEEVSKQQQLIQQLLAACSTLGNASATK
jgi:hypothetical protein